MIPYRALSVTGRPGAPAVPPGGHRAAHRPAPTVVPGSGRTGPEAASLITDTAEKG
ncbi:hypothetical protein [Streptomyces sp. LN785]|uniref:hypothetical protein n=1 Tax=Streptomyces sp. LN785 TaxID=3112983 RepID=UPI00371D6381